MHQHDSMATGHAGLVQLTSESEPGERLAYEMIGRVVAAWCKLDLELKRGTLSLNNPTGVAAFLDGKLAWKLEKRIRAWFGAVSVGADPASRAALSLYCESLTGLIPRRNDLAHSLASVAGYSPKMFSIQIVRLSGDWPDRFARWMQRLQVGDRGVLPEESQVVFRVYDRHVIELTGAVQEASHFVREASEARRVGLPFSTPQAVDLEWWGP